VLVHRRFRSGESGNGLILTGSGFLWELVLTDYAEAEFVKLAGRQLVQPIYHMVVTTLERRVDPVRFEDG
jgi:hypothetical protein